MINGTIPHQIPFSMSVYFKAIAKALKNINYQGCLTLEADAYLQKYSLNNAFAGLENLATADRKQAYLFETV